MNAPLDVLDCDALPMGWAELSAMVCFALGFAVLRGTRPERAPAPLKVRAVGEARAALCCTIRDEAVSGNGQAAIKLWRASKAYMPTSIAALQHVARALLEAEPESMVDEVVEHMEVHGVQLCCPAAAAAVLEAPALIGDVGVMEELLKEIEERLQIEVNHQVDEVLLQGFALAGSVKRTDDCVNHIRASGRKVTARGHSLAIRGLLDRGLVVAAAGRAADMHRDGFAVPDAAVTELFRLACGAQLAGPVFEQVRHELQLTSDAVEALLEDCARHAELDLARAVQEYAHAAKVPLTFASRAALLKIHCTGGDC